MGKEKEIHKNRRKLKPTEKLSVCAMLLALMLTLGFIESRIPVNFSIPGIKLGLSNSVLIFAIYLLDIPMAFTLMILKVLLSGFMFSGVSAMLYAFAGGLLSLIVMSLVSRISGVSPVVVSMCGGVFHNIGQVLVAIMIVNEPRLVLYMIVLMFVGLVTGFLSGVAAKGVIRLFDARVI